MQVGEALGDGFGDAVVAGVDPTGSPGPPLGDELGDEDGHGGRGLATATVSTIGVSKVTAEPWAGFIAITWPTLYGSCTVAFVEETRSQPAFCSLIRACS